MTSHEKLRQILSESPRVPGVLLDMQDLLAHAQRILTRFLRILAAAWALGPPQGAISTVQTDRIVHHRLPLSSAGQVLIVAVYDSTRGSDCKREIFSHRRPWHPPAARLPDHTGPNSILKP